MAPTLDDVPIPAWTTIAVEPGQVLALGAARTGARAYIAISGGIDTPPVLGSRATFHMAGVGGIGGYALKAGQSVPLGPATADGHWTVRQDCRPEINGAKRWTVEAMRGPNDDWLDEAAIERFFGSDWTVQAKSSRTGIRLTGPEFSFSRRAYEKRPEHGQDPSNILDHGYPFGAVNLAGQTPIILINDSPSTGGFINPFTVVTAAFWKLGQARPWDAFRFIEVSLDEAYELRRRLDRICTPASLTPLP
jgi:urea carboxylase